MQFQPEESTRYNRELRATQTAQFVDTGARIADMDLQGVDIQALAIAPPQYFHWLDGETGPRVNAMQNDAIFEMTREAPDRFVGVANLPMDHPEAAVTEMRRVNADLGFNGFEVNADVKGGDLDDRRFDPIWAAAEELEMLVILHPHGWTEPSRMDDYYLINVVCMPLGLDRGRIPDDPGRCVGEVSRPAHAGGARGWLPALLFCPHRPRLQGETGGEASHPRPPSEYLHKLYFDTTVFSTDAVEYLVGEFGADHVLMGSDYPFDMGPTDPLGFLADANLTEEEHALVVGETRPACCESPPANSTGTSLQP